MILVACGLKREAALIGRAGVIPVIGGGDTARLERALDDKAERHRTPILSSGVAGALDPSFKPGDIVIDGDPAFVARLQAALPDAKVGKVLGIDRIAGTVAEKQTLIRETGALAVDMESHVAERIARKHGLPFGILRIISDGANESLPPAALVGMRADGGIALGKVLLSLLGQPSQLPALIRTARHAGVAFRELRRAYDVLCGGGIGGFDLRELPLDM